MKPPPRLLDPASDASKAERTILGAIRPPPPTPAARKRVAQRVATTVASEPAPAESAPADKAPATRLPRR